MEEALKLAVEAKRREQAVSAVDEILVRLDELEAQLDTNDEERRGEGRP